MYRRHVIGHDRKRPACLVLAFLALPLCLFLPLMASAQTRPLISTAQEQPNPISKAKDDKDIRVLELGTPTERELTGGERHSYGIPLTAGQYLHLVIDQKGIDIVVVLFRPDGKKLAEVDSPNGAQGPEPVSLVAEASGSYRLEVRSLEKNASVGRYEAKIVELRAATAEDRGRVAAERVFAEAEQLSGQDTAESRLKAKEKYEQSLPLWRAVGDRVMEANVLLKIAFFYNGLGETQKAIDLYNQALTLQRVANDRSGEAGTLTALGFVHVRTGDLQKSLDYFNQARAFYQAAGDLKGEANSVTGLGLVYGGLGDKQKATELMTQAQRLRGGSNNATLKDDRRNAAFRARNEAEQLLEKTPEESRRKAINKYEEARQLYRDAGSDLDEFSALLSISKIYKGLDEPEKAIDYLNQALQQRQAAGKAGDGLAMIAVLFLGQLYDSLGQKEKALDYANRLLQTSRAHGYLGSEAMALHLIGNINTTSSEHEQAISYYTQALTIFRKIKDPYMEAETLSNMMAASKRNRPTLAIFYGKQAVNLYQELRANIKVLEEGLQRSFIKSKEDKYRELADLLISERRLPEAQQVLGMLKEEEYFDFIRRDSKEASSLNARADLTPKEAEWEKRYRGIADQLTILGRERGELLAKQSRTSKDEQRLSKLEADLRISQEAFQKFLDQLFSEFGKSEIAKERVFQLQESQGLMEDLRELASGAVALYTLVGEEKYRVILVTPDVQRAYEYPIKAADLARKVLAYREVLENPRLDPLPLAKELYQILIGPVAKDLKNAQAETLMWSLDGVLRYIPLAALHDGEKYMVERYRNVVFTPASNSRLKDLPSAKWRGLGLGVSKRTGGASALPAVTEELRGIIREPGVDSATGGVMQGKVLLNEAFTEEAMKLELRQHYPLVHIASHFQFQPGNETDSFLLLGDGKHLSLAEIKTSVNLFGGVDLLTLSACNTATGGAGADGKEVEGFGVLAQRQGAKAIVASLWPVADTSTRLLMEKFYRVRNAHPGTSKAEALREAQLSLLVGKETGAVASERERDIGLAEHSKPKGPYTHPYFWAPFILIGNWR